MSLNEILAGVGTDFYLKVISSHILNISYIIYLYISSDTLYRCMVPIRLIHCSLFISEAEFWISKSKKTHFITGSFVSLGAQAV